MKVHGDIKTGMRQSDGNGAAQSPAPARYQCKFLHAGIIAGGAAGFGRGLKAKAVPAG